jgi:hypothetical protein
MNLLQKIELVAGAGILATGLYLNQVAFPKMDRKAIGDYKWVRTMSVKSGEGLNSVALRVRNSEPSVEGRGYRLIADEIARLNQGNGSINFDGSLTGKSLFVPDYDGQPRDDLKPRKDIDPRTADPSYSLK